MSWFRWVPSSKSQLQQAEEKVLELCPKPCEVSDVEIGPVSDVDNCKIHTIKVTASNVQKKTPLLLLHGFGCGAAIFAPNLDSLSKNRDVYAIDMLGFGLSSRATLSKEPKIAEKQMIDSIEEWRRKMGLDSIVLLGHSLGGYISSSYALTHPSNVKHLILEDAWGFPEYDPTKFSEYPIWVKGIFKIASQFNALSSVRAAGPYGFNMMRKALNRRHPYFSTYFPDTPDTIPEYLYHCNMRRPTGEEFFRNISSNLGWSKFPMMHRLDSLGSDIRVSFIHASNTFISRTPSTVIQEKRGEDAVKIYVVQDSGHTIHLEKPKEFNEVVHKILDEID